MKDLNRVMNDTQQGSNEYLTFLLDGEEYGVDILSVHGIQGWDGVTRIPDTPDFMLGVINIRGAIVPIMDLRLKFQLNSVEFNTTTVVIVVSQGEGSEERVMGLVADGVSDVYRFEHSAVQPPPQFDADVSSDSIKGLVSVEQKMVIILDIDWLFSDSDFKRFNDESQAA